MNPRNRRKAKRVGRWLKAAMMFYKIDVEYKWYRVNSSRNFTRTELFDIIEKNKKLLRELLK